MAEGKEKDSLILTLLISVQPSLQVGASPINSVGVVFYFLNIFLTQEQEVRNQNTNMKDAALKGACTLFVDMYIGFIF